jgi:hypothetical protein
VETALLLTAATAATFAAGDVTPAIAYAIVLSTAVAMGLRNAVVRKLAVPDLTTTVLTLTITGLAADSALAGGGGGPHGSPSAVHPRDVRGCVGWRHSL